MIPCIQTLGHMARALRWPCMEDVRDTDDVLLLDEEKTYALIDEMIVSASRPFATRRIHIGMDEAYGLGRGKIHGQARLCALERADAEASGADRRHPQKARPARDDVERYVFPLKQLAAPRHIRRAARLSEAIVAAAPKDIDLVYWDYYTEDGALARHLFAEHARFSADTLLRAAYTHGTALSPITTRREATTRVLMTACREAGVRQAFGDDVGRRRRGVQPAARRPAGASALAEIAYNGCRTTTRWSAV